MARNDPRPSIAERYPGRERYLTMFREAAAGLVSEGYLLGDDVEALVARATEHWDLRLGTAVTSAAR